MKVNVNSMRILYRMGKITLEGVRKALERGWITEAEFTSITGEVA